MRDHRGFCRGFYKMCRDEGGCSSIYGGWNVKGYKEDKKGEWIRGCKL